MASYGFIESQETLFQSDGGLVSKLFSPSRREMDYCSVMSYKTDVLEVSRVA